MSNRATKSPDWQSAVETGTGAPESNPADGGRHSDGLELTVIGLFIAGVLALMVSKAARRGFLRDLD